MYIAIANAIYSSGAEGGGGGGGKVPLTDATFQQAVNDALAEEPVTGLFDVVPYGMMPDWDVSQVTIMSDAFDSAEFFNGDISAWDVSSVTDMDYMFASANSFNQNISTWNTISATNMAGMFSDATAFNQDISSWDVSSVTDMASMFEDTQAFNQNINSWDVSSVEIMEYMFANTTVFNQPLDSWTVSSVTDMNNMFSNALVFNQSLNSWDVSSVTDMNSMFVVAEAFDGDISAWDVSSVTDMNSMFSGNTFGDNTIFNRDISAWDVSNVTNMRRMFYKNIAFNRNLSLWGITQVTNFNDFMTDVTLSTPNYDALLIGWDAQGAMSYSGTVDFGSSQYTSGGAAEAARTSLIAKWGGINDGGAAPVTIPLANIISEYKFEDNVLDTVGTNDGTPTALTYADGLVNRTGVFNGSNSLVTILDSDSLSFTNGVNDLPFSFSMLAKFNDNNESILFNKIQSANREYLVDVFSNRVDFKVFDGSSANFLYNNYAFTRAIGVWYHFTFTYDGSGMSSGIKTYVNAVVGGVQSEGGIYTKMQNTTSNLVLGKFSYLNLLPLNGYLDCVRIWNKELTQAEISLVATEELAGTDINP